MREWLQPQWDNRYTPAQQWILSTLIAVFVVGAIFAPPVWLQLLFGLTLLVAAFAFVVWLIKALIFD